MANSAPWLPPRPSVRLRRLPRHRVDALPGTPVWPCGVRGVNLQEPFSVLTIDDPGGQRLFGTPAFGGHDDEHGHPGRGSGHGHGAYDYEGDGVDTNATVGVLTRSDEVPLVHLYDPVAVDPTGHSPANGAAADPGSPWGRGGEGSSGEGGGGGEDEGEHRGGGGSMDFSLPPPTLGGGLGGPGGQGGTGGGGGSASGSASGATGATGRERPEPGIARFLRKELGFRPYAWPQPLPPLLLSPSSNPMYRLQCTFGSVVMHNGATDGTAARVDSRSSRGAGGTLDFENVFATVAMYGIRLFRCRVCGVCVCCVVQWPCVSCVSCMENEPSCVMCVVCAVCSRPWLCMKYDSSCVMCVLCSVAMALLQLIGWQRIRPFPVPL